MALLLKDQVTLESGQKKKGVEALETLKQYPTIRSSDICINVI